MPLDALLNSAQSKTAITGALSGAAGGALVSALTNKKAAKTILKTGGLIAVGGVAMKAWQAYSQRDTAAAPAETSRATVTQNAELSAALPHDVHTPQPAAIAPPAPGNNATLILQAMVAAAHADGHLSDAEQQKIWSKGLESGLPAQELATLSEALNQPLHATQIAALATDLTGRIETFTASALIIDDQCDAGDRYLNELGTLMDLPKGLQLALRQQANGQ